MVDQILMKESQISMANSPVSTIPFALEQFTTLLAGCQWPLYIFLRGIVGDDEQARDLMQDTFYDAWRTAQRGMPPFHTGGASEVGIRRWLFHVAYNRACSALPPVLATRRATVARESTGFVKQASGQFVAGPPARLCFLSW